jgi:mannose-6-phosphate isomerase-like protein (cupin superfamily)
MSDITRVEKGWGHELWIHNSPLYCGKLLVFNSGKKFSMHFHKLKHETWYVNKGEFVYSWIDLANGELHTKFIKIGDVVTIPPGHPHQLHALQDGEIFEVSTQHFDSDSYRIWKGD